ncbi:hypothetical protein B2G69_18255 [Methylorubrum zatmanii]|nr:hypothetical protein [Methylorubrum zatmanii]ARO55883.1 hypothetical protein B2G69_18255 [Methylorubrum zatmanii]
MSFTLDEVAVEFLQWGPRLEQRVARWPSTRSLDELFAAYLRRRLPAQNAEDVASAAKQFSASATTLVDWYDYVLRPFTRSLIFRAGEPQLTVGSLARWRRLTARLDPDGLIAWRIAQDARPGTYALDLVRALPGWGSYLSIHDRGLQQVFEKGLADSHVHIEACDPVPLLWLRLMQKEIRVEDLRSYHLDALTNLADDTDTYQRRRREKELVAEAIDIRRGLEARLQGIQPLGPMPLGGPEAATAERSLLVAGWLTVRSGDSTTASDFDRYLAAKSAFLQRHLQANGAGLGLMRFREFLDRGESLHEQKLKKRSHRVRYERYRRMLALAAEAPFLTKLELRVAPFKSVKDWALFAQLWRDRFADRPPFDRIRTAFVVHFIRDADSARSAAVPMHFGRLRERLDRLSAIFQSFRHEYPQLARYVVGIDVANLERGCPPEIFVPYLKQLRGDGSMSRRTPHPAFSHWERLAENAKDRPPAGLRHLGLTYHAGEDFHHPIDGLRAISGLLDNILEPGDRVGHGLAAGWDIRRFERARRIGPVPQGVLLDNLTWLRRVGEAGGFWSGRAALTADRVILDLSHRVYREHPPGHELDRAIDLRFDMPDLSWKTRTTAHRLVYCDTYEKEAVETRAAIASFDDVAVMSHLTNEIERAQCVVVEAIRTKGVSVEANPSSNLATGTIDRLQDHPFFRFDEILSGNALTSFNTDDPGLFGTRTDIEYAIMFEAMLERGIDRSRALEMIDRARQTGVDQSFV